MIREVIGYVLVLVAIFAWFFFSSELVNYISIGMVLLSLFMGLVGFCSGCKKIGAILVLSSSVTVVIMYVLLLAVWRMADDAAHIFLESTPCRVSAESLIALDQGWVGDGVQVKKLISFYGATRELRYQGNGFFRYGFMNNKSRTVWIKSCG